ncbi:RHS repeat-associated core domain-containing protein [Flavobacterium soli]|uniref:RHS repeat-associated core domain-containing protein n=1 Tax=Flavobacterium soli TaxID=344881 RepID=UPI000407EE42|nr:RHS repeat-associated core domain-containing protein [Flavobacterium soli]
MAEQNPNSYYKTPFLFTGKEKDDYTGLHYFGARYYDSRSSIWLSVDPLAESFPNWNPYNYTMQNPINLVDPTGMSPEGLGDPNKSWLGRAWDTVKGIFSSDSDYKPIPKSVQTKTNIGNVTVGEPTITFLPDESKIYERINPTTSIVYTGGSNEAPEYMFHYPRDLGEFSQAGSDGYIWTGCMSCHASNGAYSYAARNSQEYHAGQMLAVALQVGFGAFASKPTSIRSVEDIMDNPSLLKGRSYENIRATLSNTEGWVNSSMTKTRGADKGWVLRQVNSRGQETGKLIQYHPGSRRKYNGAPYWKVSDGTDTYRFPAN